MGVPGFLYQHESLIYQDQRQQKPLHTSLDLQSEYKIRAKIENKKKERNMHIMYASITSAHHKTKLLRKSIKSFTIVNAFRQLASTTLLVGFSVIQFTIDLAYKQNANLDLLQNTQYYHLKRGKKKTFVRYLTSFNTMYKEWLYLHVWNLSGSPTNIEDSCKNAVSNCLQSRWICTKYFAWYTTTKNWRKWNSN